MKIKDSFDLYPNIRCLNERIGCGRGAMDSLAQYRFASLSVLERTIPTLNFNERPSLWALAVDLFSDDVKKIMAAICEILAFGWLKSKGLIGESEIGFPSDWDGEDPPFEGSLKCGKQNLPFDVKDGSGSGVQLLTNKLSEILSEQAVSSAVPIPRLYLSVDAPSGQRWFHDNFNLIVEPFRKELLENGLSDRVITLEAGAGKVMIGLNRSVGGSIMGIAEKASFLAKQVQRHAHDKSKKLKHTEDASRFLLIYLRRPHTGGADFDEYIMPQVFDLLSGMPELPKNLAGVLFVNFEVRKDETSPYSILWDREGDLANFFDKAVDRIYIANVSLMPKQRQALARKLAPADIEILGKIAIGSCDLRGSKCSAKGSSGAIHLYFSAEQQFGACHECIEAFKWPLSSSPPISL